ncbi:MAG TPA: hypothetical protein PLJ38_09685, partial [bacterium]|nr:hypothetical protein [bacterium]
MKTKQILFFSIFFIVVFAASYYFFSKKKITDLWNVGDKMMFEFEMKMKTVISSGIMTPDAPENKNESIIKANMLVKIISKSDTEAAALCLIDSFVQQIDNNSA